MNISSIAIVLAYFIFLTLFLIPINKKPILALDNKNSFFEKYFLANRNMTSFSMAISFVATYMGASSFIGGPGIVNKIGLGWVLLAAIQIPTLFIVIVSVGPKLLEVSKKNNLITINDFFYYRYKSKALVFYCSIILLIFSFISIAAQITAAGRVLSSITNIDYKINMIFFSLVVFIYTSIGGLKLVVKTDKIQGLVMIIATLVLFYSTIQKLGSSSDLTNKILSLNISYTSPLAGGKIKTNFLYSFWVLVGVGIIGLPAIVGRTMAFKNKQELNKTLFIGSFIAGILMILIHLTGFLAIFLVDNNINSDLVIPNLALKVLNPTMLGIFVAGFLAVVMSSIDSVLLVLSSTIIKDLNLVNYLNFKEKNIRLLTIITTLIIGLISLIIALQEFDSIVWLSILSLAGQESIFFIPIIAGLFLKNINFKNLMFSSILSNVIFLFLSINKIYVLDFHPILIALFCGLIYFIFTHSKKKQIIYLFKMKSYTPFFIVLSYFTIWSISIIAYYIGFLSKLIFFLPLWFWFGVIFNFMLFSTLVYFYSKKLTNKN